MKQANGVILVTVLVTAASARAQPAPAPPDPVTAPAPAPADPSAGAANPVGTGVSDPPTAPPSGAVERPVEPATGPLRAGAVDPPAPRPAPVVRPAFDSPEVLRIPTGWLLPAAALYSTTSVDTGGGVASDYRVGLGDVAEFGVATTDQVREHSVATDKLERIQPYVAASFRLGVAEHRLFDAQPGVTLGFRKSFERTHSGEKTRIAELTLVASKHVGTRAAVHLGAAVWDASLQSTAPVAAGQDPPREYTLHGRGYQDQVRVFAGFEARPLPRSSILVDLGWAPEFCYQCADDDKIKLRPELSWGVRYEVARFLQIESGVRVPDIGNFNLLDAQIFGQLTLTSYALRDAVDRLK
jgi:hypothetical protein